MSREGNKKTEAKPESGGEDEVKKKEKRYGS